jgi:hypothetical protein
MVRWLKFAGVRDEVAGLLCGTGPELAVPRTVPLRIQSVSVWCR